LKRAFTLIELLVVIAIIAILAAILFPVFAQAKLQAKKAADLSNLNQNGLAALMYCNDVDDTMPLMFAGLCARVQNPLDPNDKPGGTTGPGVWPMWQYQVQPYSKNFDVLSSPTDVSPSSNLHTKFYNTSLGYNYGYLSTLMATGANTTATDVCGATQWYTGITTTSVNRPADIVMFADSGGRSFTGATTIGSMMNPPDAWPSTQYFYGPVEVGWGPNCQNYFNSAQGNGTGQWAALDGNANRVVGGVNYQFVDGHSKFLMPGAAAIGTNWNGTTVLCTQIVVTQPNLYKWDPRD